MVLMICLEMPGRHTGEPEYLLATTPLGTATVLDSERSWLRNSALYRHCLTGDAAVAVGVAEGHQHLVVGGIAVVPHDPEVGSGDGETLDGVVWAVGSGHPADDRGARRTDRFRRRRRVGLSVRAACGVRCLLIVRWIGQVPRRLLLHRRGLRGFREVP